MKTVCKMIVAVKLPECEWGEEEECKEGERTETVRATGSVCVAVRNFRSENRML